MHRFGTRALAVVVALAAACSGGSSGGDVPPPPPPPEPVTVSGVVVDETGRPYAGAHVYIEALGAVTAANGTFAIANVAVPYEVAIVAETSKTITVFRGVHETAPVLSFVRQDRGTLRSGTVQGRMTDGQGMPLSLEAEVFGPSPYTSAVPDYAGDYTLTTWWFGEASATVNHRAMYAPTDAVTWWPEAYAYAVRPVAVTDGGTVAAQDFSVAPLATGRVTGSGTTGISILSSDFGISAQYEDGIARTIFRRQWGEGALGAFDVLVPALPDGAARLYYAVGSTTGTSRAEAPAVPGRTGVDLSLPPPPIPTGPHYLDPSVGYRTVFSWTTASWGGSDLVEVHCASGHVFRILGPGRSATLPDLSARGVFVPPNTRCDWWPGWASYTIDEYVQGPATVAALPVVRTSLAYGDVFVF